MLASNDPNHVKCRLDGFRRFDFSVWNRMYDVTGGWHRWMIRKEINSRLQLFPIMQSVEGISMNAAPSLSDSISEVNCNAIVLWLECDRFVMVRG